MKKIIYKLIWACAWCPKDTWTPLQKGEQWTHGICPKHLIQVLANLEKKTSKAPLTIT